MNPKSSSLENFEEFAIFVSTGFHDTEYPPSEAIRQLQLGSEFELGKSKQPNERSSGQNKNVLRKKSEKAKSSELLSIQNSEILQLWKLRDF